MLSRIASGRKRPGGDKSAGRGVRRYPTGTWFLQNTRRVRRVSDRSIFTFPPSSWRPAAGHDRPGERGNPHSLGRTGHRGRGRTPAFRAPSVASVRILPHRHYCFLYLDVQNREQSWELPANSLGFTYCQVPVGYQLADAASILVERVDGTRKTINGSALGAADSASVFSRNGKISRITVFIPRTDLRP